MTRPVVGTELRITETSLGLQGQRAWVIEWHADGISVLALPVGRRAPVVLSPGDYQLTPT